MVNKLPVSAPQNIFYDAEPVSAEDLSFEQTYNTTITSSLIDNQVGAGVILNSLTPNIIFDSNLTSGSLDGQGVPAQNQPSDLTFGNQLSITLSNSLAAHNRTVKVAVIGLDFNSNLQYETFTFHLNETQYGQKHFTNVLTILFNDFIGPAPLSLNLGGRIVIQQIAPFTISRDPIMVAQDQQPNLFFRDFFTTTAYTSLQAMLQAALPLYNFDNLNISTEVQQNLAILQGDVSTTIGEKFLAVSNNIQKITFLLSVQNSAPGQSTNLIWQGDLVVSLYPLQSTVNCPTNIVPNLPINFTPSNVPLAQTSINYSTLQAQGFVLDGNPQPIDFNFSNTQIANGVILPNQYYIATIKRSGSASACDILIAAGGNLTANSQVSTFTGVSWVDNPDLNLWFKVWTDSIKVSDGQAYESGHGIILPKTTINPTTDTTIDNSLGDIYFTGNSEYTAVLSATTLSSNPVPDQQTGNPVDTEQQYVPAITLYNAIDLANLEKASQPLSIGIVLDKNVKAIASSPTILAALHSWSFVGNTIVIKIVDDITDGYRYDTNVIALVSDLLNGLLTDAKIVPDLSNPTIFYRISSASLCSLLYGDLNQDGYIDQADLNICNSLIGAQYNQSPPPASIITTSGSTTTVQSGYASLTKPFTNDFGLTWQVVNPITTAVIATATDGEIVANPDNPTLASFESISTNFSTITNLTAYQLVVFDVANPQNQDAFTIVGIDSVSNFILDIQKILYTPQSLYQMFQADINGNGIVDENDGYLIDSYINRSSFPPSSSPYNKIATPFNLLTLTVENFVDRSDDLVETPGNRSAVLHPLPDIFTNDVNLQNHNFLTSPVSFNIVQQFTWDPWLIACNGMAPAVSTTLVNTNGEPPNSCVLSGISCENYPMAPPFIPVATDTFLPNNLILGGQIINPNGTGWRGDIEILPIILQIPNTFLGQELSLNIMSYFIADTGNGLTAMGYPSGRFSDCSTVQPSALLNNQVRFSVSLESLSFSSAGISVPDGYTGLIVDQQSGCYLDPTTGVLRLNFNYVNTDPVIKSLSTKVFINVYLKKSGFSNSPLFINQTQMANLLGLIPTS
jgi:hypothetical protein